MSNRSPPKMGKTQQPKKPSGGQPQGGQVSPAALAKWMREIRGGQLEQKAQLECLLQTMVTLHNQDKETQMAQYENVKALIAALDTATNTIADRIARLQASIGTGMTAEQEDEIKAELDALETKLRGLGADPEQPIPPA